MSLVQGISRFSYVYEGLTPFAVYSVDYIGGFAGDLVPHIVAFAGGVAELFSLHHVWTDCAPLCPTRSACWELGKTSGCVFYEPICLEGGSLFCILLTGVQEIRFSYDLKCGVLAVYTNGRSVADFRVMGLEKLNGTDEYRKPIEQLLKRKLRTFKPYGLNTKD
ncbi:hypothetical protein DPMN_107194 [Dreissena polymorpha]|uniref:Uncharacterized protein n=1 Tax=Dreissena polymorpha TaxID=45954 RepID=A0A9D4QJJ0_DREPO|nr:hypothetical protein DPMN_107194 [Dreissena polymorpha]